MFIKFDFSPLLRSTTCPSTVFVTTSHNILLQTHTCDDHSRWCCTWLYITDLWSSTAMINILSLLRRCIYICCLSHIAAQKMSKCESQISTAKYDAFHHLCSHSLHSAHMENLFDDMCYIVRHVICNVVLSTGH